MRIARKLTIALVLAVSSVLAVHGWLSARRERAFFEAESRRESRMMGRALVAVVSEIWRTQGEARAFALLAEANERDASVNFRHVALGATDARRPTVDPARIQGLAPGREAVFRDWDGDGRIITYVPLAIDRPGAMIEVSASLTEQQRYVRGSVAAIAVTTAVATTVAAAITILLGAWLVGRPMRQLIAKARRIGEGDLGGPLTLHPNDELGELASEINAMCDRLAAERTARQRAVDELRHAHRLAVVGRLAAGVAHELGTPLHVVKGWANMIATREVEGDAAREAARNVSSAAERMANTIRQLLDFARSRSVHKEPLDIESMTRRTAALLAPIAERRRVDVSVEASVAPLVMEVDGAQLQQALTNIMMNGLDAMPDGGKLSVTIDTTRATAPPEVAGGEAEWVRISVRDQGAGIAKEHLDQVFEPFFTTKEVGEGTGLGLSVTYGIVREHAGWISVESQPGHGACFHVYLPMKAGPTRGAS
ncbi:MAG: HAMP domain-containing histidine kinase [Deltaproteobacteria bacterium]|nr:HAMP domain-containing histidine kinase [Deltaproteobacteria bacterium]